MKRWYCRQGVVPADPALGVLMDLKMREANTTLAAGSFPPMWALLCQTQRSTSETYVMWVSFCPWSHKASNKVKHASMDGKFFFPLKYLGPCINNTIHFSCYFMHWHPGALYFLPERYLRGVVIAVILDINFLCWERQNSYCGFQMSQRGGA